MPHAASLAPPAPSAAPSEPGNAPKRRAILAAALELMSERTFHGTPVPGIAARAGVGAGTVYRYFPSKEALVNELYRSWKRALAAACLPAADDPELDFRARFGRLWRGLADFAREQPTAFRFLETHHHGGYLDAESRAVSDAVHAPIREFVVRAQAAGAVRSGEPDVLIALAFGAFVGLVKEADQGRVVLDERTLTASEEAGWALLRCEPEAPA